MIQKFSNSRNNRILFCIIDNLHLAESNWAKEISINLTDFMIHNIIKNDYNVFVSNNEDEVLIETVKENKYSHAVILTCGSWFGLSDRIFSFIEELCNTEFFVAGHILNRGESYYELHHQFYVVNLKEYIDLGFPKIGNEEDISHLQVIPISSIETVTGKNYVPKHLSSGVEIKQYNKKLHGWNIISNALSQNKSIIDIGDNIRNTKKYSYFDYDHVFLREVSKIYYDQFLANNCFAAWNSDNILEKNPGFLPIDQYITVGIGFNWISNLQLLGFTNNTTVKFMKKMVTDWDGVDYGKLYRDHFDILTIDNKLDIILYSELANKKWNEFISTFNDWENLWKQIKDLKYEFINIDYTASYNLDWIEPNKNTFLNLSNLFNHAPYVMTHSLKYRIACENRLLNMLNQKDSNIILNLTGRAADGFHLNLERIRLGRVSEFDLTDINNLKKPNWHLEDWNSIKLLD